MTAPAPLHHHTLPIDGMTCAACVSRLERVLGKVPGVERAEVNLATASARIAANPSLTTDALVQAVKKAGFNVPTTQMTLQIEGMTCASCVARVEATLRQAPGVTQADVNLATEQARISGIALADTLIDAVANTGYTARLASADSRADSHHTQALADRQLARDVLIAAVLTAPVFLLEMGSHLIPTMHHWLHAHMEQTTLGWMQAALTTAVLFGPGRRFLRAGLPALLRGHPDMNSLVAVGALAAWAYSWVVLLAPQRLPEGSAHLYFESAAVIITLVLTGRWLESRARGRSSAAIQRLLALQPDQARIRRDGAVVTIALDTLAPGDVLVLRPGERIAADGTVLEGRSAVDESMLTGESLPVDKQRGDLVSAGTLNTTGMLDVEVSAVAGDTALSRIITLVEQAQGGKLPIQATLDRVTGVFVPIVMGVATMTFLLWWRVGGHLDQALVHAIAVLIIACPCAMGLATPVSILVATGRGAELGVLLRRGEALQRLAGVRVVAADKTGTLTEGRPVLTDFHPRLGFDPDYVATLIAAAESGSEHPSAQAIVAAARANGLRLPTAQQFLALPGQGVRAEVDGARIQVGSAAWMTELEVDTAPVDAIAHRLAKQGRSPLFAAVDGELAAILAVADTVKPATPGALAALQSLQVPVAMVSGDNAATANAIATELGIALVHAPVLPGQKVAVVDGLRQTHGPVLFVGDGINDAPALAAADVGIAMGTGTDVAIETGDVVLVGGNPHGVPTAIALGRVTMRNIHQNLFWAFAYNAALIPVAAGVLVPLGGPSLSPVFAAAAMALSSVFVVTNALRLRRFQAPHGTVS